MSKECVISLKFSAPDNFSKMKLGLVITALLSCLFPGKLGSETLTLTTYYPAPYGGYASLLTTGRTLLASDGIHSVGIGTLNLTPASAPNGLAGNLYVNDIHLRARPFLPGDPPDPNRYNEWVSNLPRFVTYKTSNPAWTATFPASGGLACLRTDETVVSGGCKAVWSWGWAGLDFIFIGFPIHIPGFGWDNLPVPCGTEVFDYQKMLFYYPGGPPQTVWITCVRNR